jgi:hypothetical protein
MEEIWKDIKGHEGLYQISNFGRVKSFMSSNVIILKNTPDSNGYLRVRLSSKYSYRKTHKIHVLVATHFLGHEPDGTTRIVVDHIDEDKHNNHVSNLQLISNRENVSRSTGKGTSKYTGVSLDKRNAKKPWRAAIRINGKKIYLGNFEKEEDAAKAYQDKLKEIRS